MYKRLILFSGVADAVGCAPGYSKVKDICSPCGDGFFSPQGESCQICDVTKYTESPASASCGSATAPSEEMIHAATLEASNFASAMNDIANAGRNAEKTWGLEFNRTFFSIRDGEPRVGELTYSLNFYPPSPAVFWPMPDKGELLYVVDSLSQKKAQLAKFIELRGEGDFDDLKAASEEGASNRTSNLDNWMKYVDETSDSSGEWASLDEHTHAALKKYLVESDYVKQFSVALLEGDGKTMLLEDIDNWRLVGDRLFPESHPDWHEGVTDAANRYRTSFAKLAKNTKALAEVAFALGSVWYAVTLGGMLEYKLNGDILRPNGDRLGVAGARGMNSLISGLRSTGKAGGSVVGIATKVGQYAGAAYMIGSAAYSIYNAYSDYVNSKERQAEALRAAVAAKQSEEEKRKLREEAKKLEAALAFVNDWLRTALDAFIHGKNSTDVPLDMSKYIKGANQEDNIKRVLESKDLGATSIALKDFWKNYASLAMLCDPMLNPQMDLAIPQNILYEVRSSMYATLAMARILRMRYQTSNYYTPLGHTIRYMEEVHGTENDIKPVELLVTLHEGVEAVERLAKLSSAVNKHYLLISIDAVDHVCDAVSRASLKQLDMLKKRVKCHEHVERRRRVVECEERITAYVGAITSGAAATLSTRGCAPEMLDAMDDKLVKICKESQTPGCIAYSNHHNFRLREGDCSTYLDTVREQGDVVFTKDAVLKLHQLGNDANVLANCKPILQDFFTCMDSLSPEFYRADSTFAQKNEKLEKLEKSQNAQQCDSVIGSAHKVLTKMSEHYAAASALSAAEAAKDAKHAAEEADRRMKEFDSHKELTNAARARLEAAEKSGNGEEVVKIRQEVAQAERLEKEKEDAALEAARKAEHIAAAATRKALEASAHAANTEAASLDAENKANEAMRLAAEVHDADRKLAELGNNMESRIKRLNEEKGSITKTLLSYAPQAVVAGLGAAAVKTYWDSRTVKAASLPPPVKNSKVWTYVLVAAILLLGAGAGLYFYKDGALWQSDD